METKTAKIKTILFIAAAALIVLGVLLCAGISHAPVKTVLQGQYVFDGADVYSYDRALNGDWEFYSGVLLYSDPPQERPSPETVTVPDRWAGNGSHTLPKDGNASYRLVIDSYKPFAGHSNIVLSMLGFMQRYKVFINGEETSIRIPSPTGYPVYAIDAEGNVEIVIELTGSTTGLTRAPRIWAIGVNIGAIDSARNILFISSTLFCILFVMFLVFSFAQSSHKLRLPAILGILMTVLFISNMIWITGYQDSINSLADNGLWSILCVVLRLSIIYWGMHVFYKQFQNADKPVLWLCRTLPAASLIAYLLTVHILHWYSGWFLTYILAGAAIGMWMSAVVNCMYRQSIASLELSVLLTIVFGAVALLFLFDWYPDKKQILFAMPAAIICLICFCFVNYYRCQQEALKRTRELLEIERFANKTQTAMLSSQIQPHFLYNTLLTIQELCRFDPVEASRVIVRFSEYLRHNIDFMNYSELIPFESEEKHIDNFIYIQEARFQEKLRFTADIKTRDFMVPPLTVQPLLENAIKYGVRSRIEGGVVHLSVYEDAAGIHIVVRNSGNGFNPDEIRNDHSLGNIRTRLKTLLNAILTISSREGSEGSMVEIFIPAGSIIRTGDTDETGIS